MARVNESLLKDWNDGDTMYEADYELERSILIAAINDNYDKILLRYTKAEIDAFLANYTLKTGDHKGTWNGLTVSQAGEPVNSARLDKMEKQTASYRKYRSGKDNNGVFTVLELKRKSDGTLYKRSVLSNPNASGNYQTHTITEYAADGVTVITTEVETIAYDVNGDWIEGV